MTDRPQLHALAERAGILSAYVAVGGTARYASAAAKEALLAAMGFDASTEASARQEIEQLDRADALRLLRPTRVVRRSSPAAAEVRIDARAIASRPAPDTPSKPVRWRLELREEQGETHVAEGTTTVFADTDPVISLPRVPDYGYHHLTLTVTSDGVEQFGRQRRIVVPDRCFTVSDLPGDHRSFGICTNLYTVRSQHNWGIGDLTDLSTLGVWAADHGAAFVGLNPLHAAGGAHLEPASSGDETGYAVSPYSPISRWFRNVLYIDVTAVPEFDDCPAARTLVASPGFQERLQAARRSNDIAYNDVLRLKMTVLRELYARFRQRNGGESGSGTGGGSARSASFAAYRAEQGPELTRFATYCALAAHPPGGRTSPGNWPPPYRRPDSPAVEAFRRTHADEIGFHMFLQFEFDRQLAAAAEMMRAKGMSVGIYQDVAIGTSPDGADIWMDPDLFVTGARVGAPPDDYSATGQDWGLPPLNPARLADTGYAYWTRLLRANLAHSGALRIDHAMGLLRQYWIPLGQASPAKGTGRSAGRLREAPEGAYVRYPAEDLFGILALESVRHRAIIIGEDLGTVPEGFSELLQSYGVLSCQVMYFQRDSAGEFLPESSYSPRALVTATTHDHAPLRGFFSGTDLRLRRRAGDIQDDQILSQQAHERELACRQLVARAAPALSGRVGLETGLLAGTDPQGDDRLDDAGYAELCGAIYAFLSRCPAPWIGLMLDDLTGEREPINLPGVAQDRHASWTRRMSTPIEELDACPPARAALDALRDRAQLGSNRPAAGANGLCRPADGGPSPVQAGLSGE